MLAIYRHTNTGRKLLAYLSDGNSIKQVLAARKIYAYLERTRPDRIEIEKIEVTNG